MGWKWKRISEKVFLDFWVSISSDNNKWVKAYWISTLPLTFNDDPEISCKFYTITDFSTSWLLYDKNNEYIETGWECGDLILKTIYKKVVKYKYWKNGNLRRKKIYIIHQKEVKQ
ncbi:MAG: hypothetical protein MJ174_11310 [Treponema sp.]|nr:hypothetical protein [Treponema sp.]